MVNRYLYFLSFTLSNFLTFVACNKPDEPPINEPEPVFYINASLNNSPLEIAAGENGYYMYSAFSLDANDVFNFSGELKKTTCTGNVCPQSLRIRFRNNVAGATPASAISAQSFPVSYLPFSVPGGTPATYSVKFIPLTLGGQPQSFLWDFGDGTTSSLSAPTHIYSTPGIYTVTLTVVYMSGCSSSISNPLNCGVTSLSCDAGFILSNVTLNTVSLTSNPGGTPPFTYDWDFGDGTPHDNTANPTHTYSAPGVYQVCLTTVSSDNCTNTRCLNVATENPGTCSIRYSSTVTTLSNPFNLSTAIVEWTDINGNSYSSENTAQPSYAYFIINSVEDYDNNENGQKTKKLNISLNCALSDGSNTINLTNAQAVIAVAYP